MISALPAMNLADWFSLTCMIVTAQSAALQLTSFLSCLCGAIDLFISSATYCGRFSAQHVQLSHPGLKLAQNDKTIHYRDVVTVTSCIGLFVESALKEREGDSRRPTLVQASAMMAMRQLSSTILMENLQITACQGILQLGTMPHKFRPSVPSTVVSLRTPGC